MESKKGIFPGIFSQISPEWQGTLKKRLTKKGISFNLKFDLYWESCVK